MKSSEDSEMEIAGPEHEKDFLIFNHAQALLDLSMQKSNEL